MKNNLATRYNDVSVLENYHVSESFKVMKREGKDVLCKLNPEKYRLVRKRMIDGILATDLSNHNKHLAILKGKLDIEGIRNGDNLEKLFVDLKNTYENQQSILSMCLHSADISNPSKSEEIYDEWIRLLFEEFFIQGDEEKKNNLEVSYLCDRETVNINNAQVGFITYLVLPCLELVTRMFPETYDLVKKAKSNLERYENLASIKKY